MLLNTILIGVNEISLATSNSTALSVPDTASLSIEINALDVRVIPNLCCRVEPF